MSPALPAGEPAPSDGAIPSSALSRLGERPFGVYVHVPYCRVRCGYCDFNTYTAAELGPGASQASYASGVQSELQLAREVLGTPPVASTVFLGGGTPTLLPADDLVDIVRGVDRTLGLAPDAEVTTEANPDSVDLAYLCRLREGGVNRISFGMQSAVPAVLARLDRTHDPERVPQVVAWAREAGFEQVSVDLIYGTPGESPADWEATLGAAVDLHPDHVSAYALVVEEGTAMARQVVRGELAAIDPDDQADRYLATDEVLSGDGLRWYEISNWARSEQARCRHNELYWTGADWWGLGPGAHSHIGGVRWWNVKHPAAYARRLDEGSSPAAAREVLDDATRAVERVLLEIRLVDGLARDALGRAGQAAVPQLVADGLVEVVAERVVLTLRGRLLADAVVRDLVA
jgi:oxygen-independent coproporphyrinogen-3 oxidase